MESTSEPFRCGASSAPQGVVRRAQVPTLRAVLVTLSEDVAFAWSGDVIQLQEKSRKNALIQANLDTAAGRGIPGWLDLEAGALCPAHGAPHVGDVAGVLREALLRDALDGGLSDSPELLRVQAELEAGF